MVGFVGLCWSGSIGRSGEKNHDFMFIPKILVFSRDKGYVYPKIYVGGQYLPHKEHLPGLDGTAG